MSLDLGSRAGTTFLPTELIAKQPCSVCSFELWIPVSSLEIASLGIYNDARFPGRCILALNRHADSLEELSPAELGDFMLAITRSSRAIRSATGCDRVNVAILGNRDPHVHAHLIPRRHDDPMPHDAPWADPRPKSAMPDADIEVLKDSLLNRLSPSGD